MDISASGAAGIGEVKAFGTKNRGLNVEEIAELALRKLPIVIGARYEQGITELATGVREHAVIIELGGDLRAFTR